MRSTTAGPTTTAHICAHPPAAGQNKGRSSLGSAGRAFSYYGRRTCGEGWNSWGTSDSAAPTAAAALGAHSSAKDNPCVAKPPISGSPETLRRPVRAEETHNASARGVAGGGGGIVGCDS